jgi:hypothetical protein
MAVLMQSGDLAEILIALKSKRISLEKASEKIVELVEPIIGIVSQRFPLYLRDDLKQELRMDFFQKISRLSADFHSGKVRDLIPWIDKIISNKAVDYMREVSSDECRFVRIDDIAIEPIVYPKTYIKSKLIMKIRKALELFYASRYPRQNYSNRASKFAYEILRGKRPVLMTNNLTKFFHGNRILAQQAYTTSMLIIKMLLDVHDEEVRCILER